MDPEGKKIKTTRVFVEKDKNIKVDQRKGAAKYNVKLKGTKQSRSPKKQPSMKWLDSDAGTYYRPVSFGSRLLNIRDNYSFYVAMEGHLG